MPRRLLAVAAVVVAAAWSGAGHAAAATSPTKGVVLVTTNLALENASAAGTGIVLTSSGEVLTNNHVIRGATTIRVIVPQPRHAYTATVIGYDIADDVALLKLQGASHLVTVTRGNSSKLKLGQATTAVGNALGGGRLVVTTGRVTGLNRSIQVQDDQGGIAQLSGLIETSARLVPGDSGGPLLDAAGRVLGIDAAGSSSFALQASDGYAIPINRAYRLAKQIEAGLASTAVHIGDTAFIGLQLADTPAGIAVNGVVPGSPAEGAGLAQGDVITAVDGTPVTAFADLRTALFAKHPGDSVTLDWVDGQGAQATAAITLASGPPQ